MARDLFAEAGVSMGGDDEGRDLFAEAGIDAGGGDKKKKDDFPTTIGGYAAQFGTDLVKRMAGAMVGGVASIPLGLEKGMKGAVRGMVTGGADAAMPGSVYSPSLDTDETIFGPETEQQKAARQLAGERAASGIPNLPGARALADAGKSGRDALHAATSGATQAAIERSQITGNVLKGQMDFGKDPSVRGYVMQAADVFGSMLPVVATALATKNPTAGAAVGGGMAAGEGADNAREFMAKKTDAELMEQSPFFAKMVSGGASPQEARQLTLDKAQESAALLQGIVASVGDKFTGKLVTGKLDGLLTKAAGKSIAGRAAAGGIISSGEEGVQELSEGIVSDLGIASAVPTKEIGEDSAANLVLGALGGGPVGAGRGVVSGVQARRAERVAPTDPAQSPEIPIVPSATQPAPAVPATSVATANTDQAEAALRTPVNLTALDRANEIDGSTSKLQERLAELSSENGYGPTFDEERQNLAGEVAQLQQERDAIAATWPTSIAGAPTQFSTESGAKLDAQYALMDAGDLITSHDEYLRPTPTYPKELQPRDRSRDASEVQVASISQKLDPARLGVSADAATGAPIVGADGLVESGNARTIALKRVYKNDVSDPERTAGSKSDEYRQFLKSNAAQFGLSPESVDGMAQPVLVRVRSTPVNRAEFARQANASTVQRMSPSEQALTDAKRMTSLEGLNPDEDGNFGNNMDFVRQFMGTLPITEQSDLIESDGRLSTAGYRRMQNAVLARAYGDSPSLRRMTESMDNNLLNISKALVRVAPTIAAARERMDAGTLHQADIAPDLLAAVEGLSALKEKGWTAAQELAQVDLTGPKYSPEAAQVLTFLSDNARSPRRIADYFQRYYDALEQAGDPSQPSMFGDDGPAPARTDLLNKAQGAANGNNAQDPERGVSGEGAQPVAQDGRKPQDAPGNARSNEGNAAGQDDPNGRPSAQPGREGTEGTGKSEWVAFSADSGTLGIPRRDMPQIKGEDRGAMVNFLAARGIENAKGTISPGKLKATQAEYSSAKVARIAKSGNMSDRSILISSDNHVLDGHHQWMAHQSAGTDAPFIRLNAPISELLAAVRAFPSVKQGKGATDADLKAQRAEAVADFKAAMADLADIATKHTRMSMLPENTPGLMPALVKLFDASIRLLGTDIRATTNWVKAQLKKEPKTKGLWNKITPETYRKAALQALENMETPAQGALFSTAEAADDALQGVATKTDANNAQPVSAKGQKESIKEPATAASAPAVGDTVTWLVDGKEMQGEVVRAAGARGALTVKATGEVKPGRAFNVPESKAKAKPKPAAPQHQQKAAQDPAEFVLAPDGSTDYGEITPEMGKAMRRQAGKIRLQQGNGQYGLAHIEARHGDEIRKAGFASIPEFVADIAKNIDQLWKPDATSQLVALHMVKNDRVMFVQLQAGSENGQDFYTVNTAFPSRAGYVENKKSWKMLWDGRAQPSPSAASEQIPFAVPPNEADKAATNPSGQSAASVPETPSDGKKAAKAGAVEDFGEKLPPARRAMAARLDEALTDDAIASQPLSQVWPAAENAAIEEAFPAAVAHAAREAIPAKPRVAYKVANWVKKVKLLRSLAADIVSGRITRDAFLQGAGKFALSGFISKVKLLEQIDRAEWKRIGDVVEAPDALRYENGERVATPMVNVTVDGKAHWFKGSGSLDAHMEGIKALLATDAPESRMQFEIRQERGGERRVFINKKGDSQYRELMSFATAKEARDAIESKYIELVDAWEGVKGRDNITERDLRTEENRPRTGKDWREGKDVSAEEFQNSFGFKGGEFGKWVSQGKGAQERQFMLNSAYDALMDLSDLLGIPPKAVSLEGSLGIAFGSRGGGWASAHFEPSNLVINLTKPRGAGALAHEWFHALDNYFARKRGGEVTFTGDNNAYRTSNFITHKTTPLMVRKDGRGSPLTKQRLAEWRKSRKDSGYLAEDQWHPDPNHKDGVRAEVEQRFDDLVQVLNASPMLKRARLLEGSKSGDGYWSRTLELAARSFENYVQTRMMEQGYHNDFLANVKPLDSVSKNADRYPYLLPSEIAPISDAFDSLFREIQTKEDEAGNVAMLSMAGKKAVTADTHALTTARQRLDAGEDAEAVRQDTGWHKGADGKWRFEISDDDALLRADLGDSTNKGRSVGRLFAGEGYKTLGSVLYHPALFSAYPALVDTPIRFAHDIAGKGIKGSKGESGITLSYALSPSDALSTLLHEVQHSIQSEEGFASGGNPENFRDQSADRAMLEDGAILARMYSNSGDMEAAKVQFLKRMKRGHADGAESAAFSGENPDAMQKRAKKMRTAHEQYLRLAGETEARNTQARQGMSPEQRRATSPESTADVPASDVIVTFNGKDMANAPAPANAGPMPQDAPAKTIQVAEVRAAITKAYGSLLDKLEKKGLVVLVQSEAEAIRVTAKLRAQKKGTSIEDETARLTILFNGPAALPVSSGDIDIKRSTEGDVQGFFDQVTGKAVLIADGLTEQSAGPVLMHEVGIHMASDGTLKPLFDRAAGLLRIGPKSEFLNRVRERMASAGEKSGEESAAYITEEYERDRASAPATVTKWIADLTAAVRAWLFRKGIILKAGQLTVADIAAVARANARSLAAGQGGITTAVREAFGPAFSVMEDAGGRALAEFAKADDLFALPKSAKDTVVGIVGETDSLIKVGKPINMGGRVEYTMTMPDGAKATLSVRDPNPYGGEQVYDTIYTDEGIELVAGRPGENPEDVPLTGDVWIDVSALKKGDFGAKMYSIAATYAHNTGRIFIGDPHGLSADALRRRLEQMISSALKFGTTAHLAPHPDQVRGGHGVPPLRWVYGDDVGNVERMIAASVKALDNGFPSSNKIAYDPDRGFYRTDTGAPMSRGQLAGMVGQSIRTRRAVAGADGSTGQAGWRTVARAALFRYLQSAIGPSEAGVPERGGVLAGGGENVARLERAEVGGGPFEKKERIFYSRQSGNGANGVTPGAAAAPKTPWQQLKARAEGLMSADNIDKFLYDFQDKLIDLKRLRQHIKDIGGTITDLNDAYQGEELYHKRVAKRTENFLNDELKPLLAQMRSKAIALSELEQFLHARHAPEANKELSFRNPNQQMIDAGKTAADAQILSLELSLQKAQNSGAAVDAINKALDLAMAQRKRWNGAQAFKGSEAERLSLSGMSDAESAAVMAALSPEKRIAIDALAAKVDDINQKTLQSLKTYGLMDAQTLDLWNSTYKHYVPLHRDEAHPDSASHPVGQGFSVKGDAGKRRAGSNQKVTNILGHIAMQREAALTRGEKNMVGQKLYIMAAQNPDADWWSVDRPPLLKSVDKSTGFTTESVDPLYKNRPNVVMVRIAGKDVAVVFNERNERAARLAQSLKNLDASDMHMVLGWASKGTRWFASVNTQYNPVFGVINFARDAQAALLGLGNTPLLGKEAQVAKNMLPALKAIYADQRAIRRGGKSGGAGGAWGKLWDEMQMAGGTTGYRDLYADPKDRVKGLEKAMSELERGSVGKFVHGTLDWLNDYNESMEGATRLAAYKVALDSGMSRDKAASLAKNLTVNFNRKGRQAREIGALYAFFNAAVQGSARMVEVLRGPTGKKVMLGGVLLGATNAMIGLAMMGGGDDDDENGWAKIPEFVRERSLVIPLGKEDFVAIPLPLGFNVFPNVGRKAVEAMAGIGGKSAGSQLASMLAMMVNTFNPLGAPSEASLAQASLMLSPTITDPIVSLLANKDWTGKPIYRADSNSMDPTPGHLRTKDSASTPSKLVSRGLNSLTGGTDYRPGAVSWTPDQLDYVIGQLTGGVGRELMKVNQMATAPFTGDELPAYKIPLLGRLYGNIRGVNAESGRYFENVRELNEIENELKGRERDDKDPGAYMDGEPLTDMIGQGNQAERMVQRLRKQRAQATKDGDAALVKELNEDIADVMKDLNREMSRTRREASAR